MHIVSTLANHEFLKLGEVLDTNVTDAFAYMQYTDAKVRAERAQTKFLQETNARRK